MADKNDSFMTPESAAITTTTTTTASLQDYLRNTITHLQIQEEVERVACSMKADVEFAVQLQRELGVELRQRQTAEIIHSQEVALQEATALVRQSNDHRAALADGLVEELYYVSQELETLLDLKQKHELMQKEYDLLVTRLARTEEQLKAQQQQQQPKPQQQQQKQPTQTTPVSSTQAVTTTTVAATTTTTTTTTPVVPPSSPEIPTENAPGAAAPSSKTASAAAAAAVVVSEAEEDKKPAAVQAPVQTKSPPATTAPATTAPAATTTASQSNVNPSGVVALVDDGDEELPSLINLDMEILMRIFGFLDAFEILNVAQVNILMYSRVDSLFGFSMDVPGMMDESASITTQGSNMGGSITSRATTNQSVSTAKTPLTTTAPKKDPPTKKPPPSTATTATTGGPNIFGSNLVDGGIGGGRLIRSLLQPRVGPTTGSIAGRPTSSSSDSKGGSATTSRSGSRHRQNQNNTERPALSEAMASSMAAKLDDAEINAIISMTERLRAKERNVAELLKEKEALEGKLNGSEAVKDFLITKVRDMEASISKTDETEKKVTQQIASDQEVIAFLDTRVQELEKSNRMALQEKTDAQEKLVVITSQHEKKIAVLSDMLQFEREKSKENEREWKNSKKVLIREVKSCRATLVALQAERDGLREQNEVLKRAFSSPNSPNGIMSSLNNGAAANNSPHRSY